MNPHDGEPSPAGGPTAASPTTTESAESETTAAAPGLDQARELLDLERIGRDLDGVEAALRRLDDGSYWTDEVTGAALPDELLAADPVARRVEG